MSCTFTPGTPEERAVAEVWLGLNLREIVAAHEQRVDALLEISSAGAEGVDHATALDAIGVWRSAPAARPFPTWQSAGLLILLGAPTVSTARDLRVSRATVAAATPGLREALRAFAVPLSEVLEGRR